jgi:hypothetical protein
MKKLVVLSVFALAFAFTSCTGCDRKKDPAAVDAIANDSITEPVEIAEEPVAATPATEVAVDEVKTETTTTEVKK